MDYQVFYDEYLKTSNLQMAIRAGFTKNPITKMTKKKLLNDVMLKCVRNGHLDVVTFLVNAKGANINATYSELIDAGFRYPFLYEYTLLYLSVKHRHFDLVKFFIEGS